MPVSAPPPASCTWTGAPADAACTRAEPCGSIAHALDLAAAGDTIALSRGTFDEPFRVSAAVTVRGACVAETIVAPPAGEVEDAAVELRADAVALSDLTIAGDRIGLDVRRTERGRSRTAGSA